MQRMWLPGDSESKQPSTSIAAVLPPVNVDAAAGGPLVYVDGEVVSATQKWSKETAQRSVAVLQEPLARLDPDGATLHVGGVLGRAPVDHADHFPIAVQVLRLIQRPGAPTDASTRTHGRVSLGFRRRNAAEQHARGRRTSFPAASHERHRQASPFRHSFATRPRSFGR
jgi:hypothetical protein